MQTPVIPEQDGQGEERRPAGLVTPRQIDTNMRWLPILGYEESEKERKSLQKMGKQL